MALSAKIQFGDNDLALYSSEYQLSACKTHFNRHHTSYYPDAEAKCQDVELTIVASNRYDLNIQEWYINKSALSGRIVFDISSVTDDAHGSTPARIIEFEDAECYSIAEEYTIREKRRREYKLLVTARKFKIGDTVFERR